MTQPTNTDDELFNDTFYSWLERRGVSFADFAAIGGRLPATVDLNKLNASLLADRKKHELDVRKDQTFKVIQSLVKNGSISDSSAAHTLALQTTLLDIELKTERDKL